MDPYGNPSSSMDGFMTLFWVFFVLVFVGGVATTIYRFSMARKSGVDPIAGDIQLMGKVVNSAALAPQAPPGPAPEKSASARLAEVDALLAAGTINAAEHEAARAHILGTL
jgi:hypothetical protein